MFFIEAIKYDFKRRNTGTVAKHRDIPCRMHLFKQIWEEYSKDTVNMNSCKDYGR